MSEYQYYEFQAIDRPLTNAEMAELRALSTRATITPNRFQNVYNYGDFKGDSVEVLSRYFDAFIYITNWGFQQLMFRLPRHSLDRALASHYEIDPNLQIWTSGDYDIVSFVWNDEEGGGWVDDVESEAWLPSLSQLRADLMAGDQRSLYLGWLAAAQVGELDDDEQEPPVPPGLRSLSAPLKSLTDFMGLDADLVAVAAEQSGTLREQQPAPKALRAWIQQLSEPDKDDWLSRLIIGTEPPPVISRELLQRYRQEHPMPDAPLASSKRRTVAELLSLANGRAEDRSRAEAERSAQERNQVLDRLAAHEVETWITVETLIATKRPASYDEAVSLLTDLRDLARREHRAEPFTSQLRELHRRHAAKPSLLRRLDHAGLLVD
ncbi:MAG TPA: hypothetical protein VHV31_08110 [Nitrolancea sp.]|jgi:hypothetical protein|nr:hypothetical protein [Nitrolancea sp.]